MSFARKIFASPTISPKSLPALKEDSSPVGIGFSSDSENRTVMLLCAYRSFIHK